MTDPIQKGTIQEIIDQKYGTCEVPCRGNLTFSPYDLDFEAEDDSKVVEVNWNPCPYDGTRKRHCVASFNSYPWLLSVEIFNTITSIP